MVLMHITTVLGIATVFMAENHIKTNNIVWQCQAKGCCEHKQVSPQTCPSPSFPLQLAHNHAM